MRVFWLNGDLVLHPDTGEEGDALALVFENTKQGRPEQNDPGRLPQREPVQEEAA